MIYLPRTRSGISPKLLVVCEVKLDEINVEVFGTMKMFKVISALVALLITAGTQVFAAPQREESGSLAPLHRGREVYVWVTGSRIPQKVILSPVGTPSFNAMSVYDRKQIDYYSAHPTTEYVLRYEPSAQIIGY
jgi:hypothetical protein